MMKTFKVHAIGALEILKVVNGKIPFDYEQYKTLRAEGLTNKETADRMGISEKTLYRNLENCHPPGDRREMQAV
jgi:hypothetical protein